MSNLCVKSKKIPEMIKELVQFTETCLADEEFKNLGVAPKEGLHIVLQVEKTEVGARIADKAHYAVWSKKSKDLELLHQKCAAWAQVGWMVDTNKCFDLPVKAIHSASPFCFALKRENLVGGEKYAANQRDQKSQVYDRINAYFAKAQALLASDEDKNISEAFRLALNDGTRFQWYLNESGVLNDIKDGEYVIFYLDLPVEQYRAANQKYLKEKLFNTGDYNLPDATNPDLLHGTSNYLNGFPTKKPFLVHQSATFDIAGRISSLEAQLLYEFGELSKRGLFPRPLPLFVKKEEREKALVLFKQSAGGDNPTKKSYQEIILELYHDFQGELGNYFLLFQMGGEIRDFDFVSKFEYELKDQEGNSWKIDDVFGTGKAIIVENVFDFQRIVMPVLFNNALVSFPKDKDARLRYFDDIDPAYCKTHNAFLLAMKYRKAFYDFIYKSKRQSVTQKAIEEILITGILDDIRLDEYKERRNTENFNIRSKLNLLFGVHQYFSKIANPNFMANKINELRERVDAVARGEAGLESDQEFAFAAGQVIDRIFFVANTSDKSFGYLEPFLAQSNAQRLKDSIAQFFKRYTHGNYSKRFKNVSAQVMAYEVQTDKLRNLMPLLLAGVFSENQLFADKKEEPETLSPAVNQDL